MGNGVNHGVRRPSLIHGVSPPSRWMLAVGEVYFRADQVAGHRVGPKPRRGYSRRPAGTGRPWRCRRHRGAHGAADQQRVDGTSAAWRRPWWRGWRGRGSAAGRRRRPASAGSCRRPAAPASLDHASSGLVSANAVVAGLAEATGGCGQRVDLHVAAQHRRFGGRCAEILVLDDGDLEVVVVGQVAAAVDPLFFGTATGMYWPRLLAAACPGRAACRRTCAARGRFTWGQARAGRGIAAPSGRSACRAASSRRTSPSAWGCALVEVVAVARAGKGGRRGAHGEQARPMARASGRSVDRWGV